MSSDDGGAYSSQQAQQQEEIPPPSGLSHFLHCIPEHGDADASRPDGLGEDDEDCDGPRHPDAQASSPPPAASAAPPASSTSSSSCSSWLQRRCHLSPSYALGLSFLLVVALIWSLASILVQELYTEYDFHSPFVLTYLCTSLFMVLLPSRLIAERLLPGLLCFCGRKKGGGGGCGETRMPVIPWNSEGIDRGYTDVASFDRDEHEHEHEHEHELVFDYDDDVDGEGGEGGSASARAGGGGALDDDDPEGGRGGQHRRRPMGGGGGDGSPLPDAAAAMEKKGQEGDGNGDARGERGAEEEEQPLRRGQLNGGRGAARQQQQRRVGPPAPRVEPPDRGRRFNHDRGGGGGDDEDGTAPLGHVQHIKMAARICPVWFLSNFAYNYSLACTSIASSTVLASTGSLFTFLFAVSCGDESCNVAKFTGVALCVVGGVLTSIADAKSSSGDDSGGAAATTAADDDGGDSSAGDGGGGGGGSTASFSTARAIGDLAGLISAVGYGAYTVLIRTQCPRDESRMSMQLLFGYIGLLNMIALLPFVLLSVFVTRSVDVDNLTWTVLGWIVVKGLLDNVLSDYLWARAVVLTSATVATVGLGLTIPLAFASDFVLGSGMGGGDGGGGGGLSPENLVGALVVLVGFILVNVGSGKERQ